MEEFFKSLMLPLSSFTENFDFSTFLSAVVSGVFSFIGGYLAARKAAKAQILTTAQTSFVSAKLDAFRDFEDAFERWCNNKDRAACAKMYHYGNAILLVANEETSTYAHQLLAMIREFEVSGQQPDYEEISDIHVKLVFAMKADLLTFPVPKAESNKKHRRKK